MTTCTICHKNINESRLRDTSLVEIEKMLYTLDIDVSVRNATKERLHMTCHQCIDFMIQDMKLEHQRQENKAFTIVDPQSPEYQKLDKLFHQTLNNRILRIEKNNNAALRNRHNALSRNACPDKIKYLFHGSGHDNYIKIMTRGFDINLSKDGALGRGIYFADNASYSSSYTHFMKLNNSHPVANMLICRVYLRDDTKHSVDIHCVQHQDLGFPEYVVYYAGDDASSTRRP